MKCLKCGNFINDGVQYCPECGCKIEQNCRCPNCGETIGGTEKFCCSCGYSLKAQDNISENTPTSAPINAQNSSDSADVKYPPEEVINQLMERNSEAKAAIFATIGTRFLNKWLVPILRDGEKLITVDNIQTKWLFGRYRRECVVLTNQRVLKLEKLQYFKPKIEECELSDIRSIEVDDPANAISATVIGEKLRLFLHSE